MDNRCDLDCTLAWSKEKDESLIKDTDEENLYQVTKT